MLILGNGEDVKISLDCMRQPSKPEQKKTVMIYVAIYVARKKTTMEILNTNF